ncbi:MAG: NAD-dependent epimerase/dehydratase family protein, partial [Betaproteobacteria bacterium]
MSTLITGAGLIGCQTAALLVGRGERVVLLDREPCLEYIASVVEPEHVTVVTADIRDRDALIESMKQHRVTRVLHTAAALSMSIRREPTLASDVNLLGTVNVLEAGRLLGLQRVVCASSTTVYYPIFHRPHAQPISEDFSFHSVSERPGSLYAASKLAGEFFAQHYAQTFGLSIAVLRYSAVLGLWAGPNHSVPGRLMAELLGQGAGDGPVHISDPLLMWSGGEDFIDAREVARANVAALDAPVLPSCVYTIASGHMTRFADFVDAARQLQPGRAISHTNLPATGFAGFAHPRDLPFNVSRAKLELGFE